MSLDSPRHWLKSVISTRKYLIFKGFSKTDYKLNLIIIEKLELWLDCYPNASDFQVLNFISIYRKAIWYLIPKNKATNKIVQKINKLKYAVYQTSKHR